MRRNMLVAFLTYSLAICLSLSLPNSAFATLSPPSDQLIVFDENPFDGSPRGFFEVSFGGASPFLVNIPITSSRLLGLAYRPADGFAYSASADGQLWRLDTATGTPVLLGTPGVNSLTVSPVDGAMYGVGPGARLYRINPDTVAATLLGTIPFLEGGIAAGPDGLVYGLTDTATKVLIAINPVTLAVNSIGPINASPISDLEFTSDGRLFGINWDSARVYEFDPSSGATTLVTTLPNNHNGAIGIFAIPVIPEPGSILLAAGSLLLVMIRPQR